MALVRNTNCCNISKSLGNTKARKAFYGATKLKFPRPLIVGHNQTQTIFH